jgi:preprotein translocase subunit SecY
MIATIKQLFKSTNKDLRKRVIYTLLGLTVFALGNAITVPNMKAIVGDLGFLELLNALSGGGLKQFSIFALGVMPYISASILIQILQMDILPFTYFKELKEMGEEGRQKTNKITRYLGILFAFIQGYVYAMMFIKNTTDPMEYLRIATILTAGTAFLLWLGDQITQKGIGNGTSLIIMAGIVNTMPSMFITAFGSLVSDASNNFVGVMSFILFVLLYIGIIIGVIFTQEAERRISIQYSNRSVSSSYGGRQTFLPLKLNSAGVMPVIFASAILSIPSFLSRIVKNEAVLSFVNKYLTTETTPGMIVYVLFILFFAYFYTFMIINPENLAKNLNENGGYIPGIRPGSETKKYISMVLSRITFLGAIFIAIIAVSPMLFTSFTNLPSVVKVGGTGILIVVGVLLETYKQMESSIASRSYNRR